MTKTKKESKTPLKDKVEEDFKKIEEKAASFAISVTETCETTARVIERWQKSHPEATEEERHEELVAVLHSAILITLINV